MCIILFVLVLCSTKPLLVIDGLKLLAVQLKDVSVCAKMVRPVIFVFESRPPPGCAGSIK
jgi:hypothetical protein